MKIFLSFYISLTFICNSLCQPTSIVEPIHKDSNSAIGEILIDTVTVTDTIFISINPPQANSFLSITFGNVITLFGVIISALFIMLSFRNNRVLKYQDNLFQVNDIFNAKYWGIEDQVDEDRFKYILKFLDSYCIPRQIKIRTSKYYDRDSIVFEFFKDPTNRNYWNKYISDKLYDKSSGFATTINNTILLVEIMENSKLSANQKQKEYENKVSTFSKEPYLKSLFNYLFAN